MAGTGLIHACARGRIISGLPRVLTCWCDGPPRYARSQLAGTPKASGIRRVHFRRHEFQWHVRHEQRPRDVALGILFRSSEQQPSFSLEALTTCHPHVRNAVYGLRSIPGLTWTS